jgi:hypothetical protein
MFMIFFIVESSPLQFATFNLKMWIHKYECGMYLYYGHEKTCYEKCQFKKINNNRVKLISM